MAATWGQVCCYGAVEGGDSLQVLPLLELVFSIPSGWAISVMGRFVDCMQGRTRDQFCGDRWQEADPSFSGPNPDWEMLLAGFSTCGELQYSGLEFYEPHG